MQRRDDERSRLRAVLAAGERHAARTDVLGQVMGSMQVGPPVPPVPPVPAAPPAPLARSRKSWTPAPNASPRDPTVPFSVKVDALFGMDSLVTFEPDSESGAMPATVFVTDVGQNWWGAPFGPWLKQSKWYFSGPPGREVPILLELSNGDSVVPNFEMEKDGNLILRRYQYIPAPTVERPTGYPTWFTLDSSGAYVPDSEIYNAERAPTPLAPPYSFGDWNEVHSAILDSLYLAIRILMHAAMLVGMKRAFAHLRKYANRYDRMKQGSQGGPVRSLQGKPMPPPPQWEDYAE